MEPLWSLGKYVVLGYIDPMQKQLPLNYSFVHIQIAQLTSLGITNSLEFCHKNDISWAILNMNKRII